MRTEQGIGWLLAGVLGVGDAGGVLAAQASAANDASTAWPARHAQLLAAWHAADASALTDLLADTAWVTDADGRWLDRAQVLARPAPAASTSLTDHGIAARRYGAVWLIEGVLTTDSARTRYSATYLWQREAWRLIALQLTPLRAAQDSNAPVATAPTVAQPWRGMPHRGDDAAVLHALNEDYVQAFRAADVAWYDAHLAPEYHVVFGDGSRHDRAAALADFAKPYFAEGIRRFPVDRVQVRQFGEVALIHAENAYALKDGRHGINRYTDIWVRREGRWWCVAAHITVHQPASRIPAGA